MRLACIGLIVVTAALFFGLDAQAQTRTSTGVEVQTQRLQEELQDWESSPAQSDSLGQPFSGPGSSPRTTPASAPPRLQTTQVTGKPAFNQELYDEGAAQRRTGIVFLSVGVTGAVVGSILGVAGWVKALTRSTSSGSGPAAMVLGGLAVGGAGAGGIVVGSVMMHRGGKKMDRAKGLRLSQLGPTLIDGRVPGVALGFTF